MILRRGGAVTLVDIVLVPEWRGRGLGTRLIGEIMDAAGPGCRSASR